MVSLARNRSYMLSTGERMALKPYRVDCYFPDPKGIDGLQKVGRTIKASSNAQAIKEAPTALRGEPTFYKIVAVTRKGEEVIYDSRDGT